MKDENSGTSRSGTRQMSAAANSAGTCSCGRLGSRVTLRSPVFGDPVLPVCLSAPSPTNANRIGSSVSWAAASATDVSPWEMPCVPA